MTADEEFALPDGAVESHRIIARAYITAEGKSGYSVHARGEATASSFLGLLVFAQQNVLGWSEGDE